MTAALLILGLLLGNGLWQLFRADPSLWIALDRTYYQAVAVLAYAFVLRYTQ